MDALHLSGSAPDFNSVSDPHEAGSSRVLNFGTIKNNLMVENTPTVLEQQPPKKKRNTPGNHDPDVEVVALSANILLAVNEYVCEFCNKSFSREQNLQLHYKSHKLNVVLKKNTSRNDDDTHKKVYVCPDESCRHHHSSKALGDLTGMKKHYQRKHGDKKFKCIKCGKIYGVQSDLKAHTKVCGTKDYLCDCGMHFNRRCLYYTHKALCRVMQLERSSSMASMMSHPHQDNIQPPPDVIIASGDVLHAPLFPTEAVLPPPPPPPQGVIESTNYTTGEASSMIGVTPFGEMMGLTPFGCTMSHLQYIGSESYGSTHQNDYYYYMPGQSNPELPTRDFLGLSAANNGGGGVAGDSFGIGSISNNNVGGFGRVV